MDWKMSGLTNEVKQNTEDMLFTNQQTTVRRASFALNLPGNLGVGSAKRRFSNVSDVVSRRISNTIGWRSASDSVDLIVQQGSALCGEYIKNRLKRSGIYQRKLGLKRMRSSMMSADTSVVDDVTPVLIALGSELEKMHPHLFVRVSRQVGCGHFSDEQTASDIIIDVSREMLRASGAMTWSKIVALYAVAGGVAVDCVRQDKAEYISAIQRAMTEILEEDLAVWIQANGSWSALSARYRPVQPNCAWQECGIVTLIVCSTVLIGLIVILLRILII